jgi:hypothetical protein
MILSELLKLFVGFRIHNILYHVFWNYLATTLLRTFESVPLSGLLYLILEEIFVSIFAKLVATFFLGNEEFTLWVVIIADLTKYLASSLKVTFLFND